MVHRRNEEKKITQTLESVGLGDFFVRVSLQNQENKKRRVHVELKEKTPLISSCCKKPCPTLFQFSLIKIHLDLTSFILLVLPVFLLTFKFVFISKLKIQFQ